MIAVFTLFRRYLQTPLGPIDDHEYPYYRSLNPSGNAWAALGDGYDRAALEFANQARFRPIYHLGRTLSVALFDQAALPRYTFRLLILASTLFLVGVIVARFCRHSRVGYWTSHLFGVTATIPFLALLPWPDVIGRLGPPDSLSWLGIVLFCFFIFLYFERNKAFKSLLFPAVLLMTGFRENYAVLSSCLVISPLLFPRFQPFRKLPSIYFAAMISFLGSGLVFLTLAMQGGTDYYGNTRGFESLLDGATVMMSSNSFANLSFAGLVSLLCVPRRMRPVVGYMGLLATSIMFVEFLIYHETIFVYPRYGLVAKAIVLVAWISTAMVIVGRFSGSRWSGRLKRSRGNGAMQFCCGVMLLAAVGGAMAPSLGRQEQVSRVQQRLALGFQVLLTDIQAQVIPGQDVLILVDSASAAYGEVDLSERAVSLQRFLAHALGSEANVELSDIAGNAPNSAALDIGGRQNCVLFGVSADRPAPASCNSTFYIY